MKLLLSKLFLAAAILAGCITGCTKKADGITGPAGPQGPAGPNGTMKASPITGYVDVYDQYDNRSPTNYGVIVSTRKGDSLFTATTDSSGKFALPALLPGNYDILFSKPGYDSLKSYVSHSGGDEAKFLGIIRIDQSQTTKITSEDYSYLRTVFAKPGVFDIVSLNVHFDGPPQSLGTRRNFGFFFSKSANVNSDNYAESSTFNQTTTDNNIYTLQYVAASGYNFAKGDTVYVKTYLLPGQLDPVSWFDYTTYRTIPYPYKGDSILINFVWPD